MRRIITLTLLALTVTAGTAAADRYRGDRHDRRAYQNRDHRRPVVRDVRQNVRRDVRRDHRRDYQPTRRVVRDRVYRNVDRRPIYVRDNRFVFNNGRTFNYRRPVIRQRFFDVRVRPQILVEHHDPVPGYIWANGHWNWNGYEWIWIAGHYQVDSGYRYNDAYYFQAPVADHDCY
jgi:hypothetical protein